MNAFWQGVLAGYGIAMPVGAIAILILGVSLRGGFMAGFAAGAGAATADLLFATLAAVAGQALAGILAPVQGFLQVLGGLALLTIGGWGLWQARRMPSREITAEVGRNFWKTYSQFLGLTLLNPMTIAYFASLILGGGKQLPGLFDRAVFVLGAALASLSWQTLLAVSGALGRSRLSPRLQQAISVVGNLIVLGLGVRMMLG